MDQLIVITKILGYPKEEDLEFISDTRALEYIKCLPRKKGTNFKEKFKAVDSTVIDFLEKCLIFNPHKRITV